MKTLVKLIGFTSTLIQVLIQVLDNKIQNSICKFGIILDKFQENLIHWTD